MDDVHAVEYEDIIYTITDEQARKNMVYSLEESDTGKTWIDGKKIYRKIIDFGALPNSSEKRVAHGITNLDTVIELKGIAKNSAGLIFPLPYIGGDFAHRIQFYINGVYVVATPGTDRSEFTKTYITMEYTKAE
ncbi:MAG: hypothetical protein ACI4VW_00530 [Acutalibacteraceae bacterium]